MMRHVTVLCLSMIGLGMVGCGGGDDNSSGNAAAGYNNIATSVAHPTGTLAASNANNVAEAYAKIDSAAANGRRLQSETSTSQTVACDAGGSYSVSASGGETAGQATLGYNHCCYTEGCCINGTGTWYYTSQASASYSMCGSYSLTVACDADNGTLNYQGCMSESGGDWTYVVTVDGKTYSVSGTYSSGSGTLKITDSKGTYTCTYSQGTGSCTGAGSFSF
jgi:hypothetical protein